MAMRVAPERHPIAPPAPVADLGAAVSALSGDACISSARRGQRRVVAWFAAWSLAALGCSSPVGQEASAVVHQEDDRGDYFDLEEPRLKELVARSSVTLFPDEAIVADDPDNVRLYGYTLGQENDLCEGEAYADQPSMGFCSGTLIGDDLVLTAGHCMLGRDEPCAGVWFAFGYHLEAPGSRHPMTHEDIFRCSEVVAVSKGWTEDGYQDHAIVRLERAATPRFLPVPILPSGRILGDGQELTVLSSPAGIPTKVDRGAIVIDARAQSRDYFFLNSDTFGGSSGGGIFDRQGQGLLGQLTAGQDDFEESPEGCNRVKVCPEGGCDAGYERASYAYRALEQLCQLLPDEPLCQASSGAPADTPSAPVSPDP